MHLDDVVALGGEPTRNRDLRTRGRQTIAKLLRAGQVVVEERGHDLARVDDIVARAGVSHGTFYLYFRDRDDMLRSLIRHVAQQLQPLGAQIGHRPEVDQLAIWIRDAISSFDEHAEVLRAAQSMGSDDAITALINPVATALGGEDSMLVAQLLLCHIARATVRDDIVDASALARVTLRAAAVATV
ncbi:MAG: AcrR family transcriptional regulator [Nonlabens sp.]|jgi:AcrR family transcriptional regulator